jgi:hypothetical protein
VTTVTAAGLAIAAPSLAGGAQAGTGWQLVAKAVDRNSSTPSASIIAEELYRFDRPARIVTQSTRPGNKLTWNITCYRTNLYGIDGTPSSSGTYTSRGGRWPGRGTNSYRAALPAMPPLTQVIAVPGRAWPLVRQVATADCYATVHFDAPCTGSGQRAGLRVCSRRSGGWRYPTEPAGRYPIHGMGGPLAGDDE